MSLSRGALRRTMQMIGRSIRELDDASSELFCASRRRDRLCSRLQKIALVLALEGAESIGADLSMVHVLYKLGVRIISFTWNRRTMLADGIAETGAGGVTTLGAELWPS